ncbi:hypothetical protein MVES1_001221 [Malassezia vespertilionis]|uniref:BZIP domain-containing protein n=1 Tax=Malassezia vespertilionis TaxID=2020962 RepID=A0A2N1JDW2_9BASI|nr:uncharacterized protein MVES1_001221 [Malassezia vespertilionis]PKI84741.1 hypothetical protein MVES_001150 [Malassezia vespertilionis]WFD05887.1 hypothetical protein MVES1_001221 [Malassezia vespertilionis]
MTKHAGTRPARSPWSAASMAEEEEEPSSPTMLMVDEDELSSNFLADVNLDAFAASLDTYIAYHANQAAAPSALPVPSMGMQSGSSAAQLAPPPSSAPNAQSELYSTAIQILTYVLGRPPDADNAPKVGAAASMWDNGATSAHASDSAQIQTLVNKLAERLGGNQRPSHTASEQELTELLQTLMTQQQLYKYNQQSSDTPSAKGFADLTFPEEEEEDDPDFQPVSEPRDDLVPSELAWTQAMREVVNEQLFSPTASPTKATRARTRTEATPPPLASSVHASPALPLPSIRTQPQALEPEKRKKGRRLVYTAEEAADRKRVRNRLYMSRKRMGERDRSPPTAPHTEDLVLEAENRFLRTEIERLREENARLRGREEMRMYAAQMGLEPGRDAWSAR